MTVGELLAEVDPGPKIFEPDGVNDMQAEFDSLPQDQIPRIRGSPEGIVFGRIGYILVDFETGKLWKKSTTNEVATGWEELQTGSSSGTVQNPIYNDASPPVAPSYPNLPALYYPPGTGTISQWDVITQTWI